jgi:hypothetical protein
LEDNCILPQIIFMEIKQKELSIEEQVNEFCEIISSIVIKQILREERLNESDNITSTHQNSDKYP